MKKFWWLLLAVIFCGVAVALWHWSPASVSVDLPGITPPASNLNDSFGIAMGDTLTHLSADELNTRLDDLVAMHVGWVRMDFDWSSIQSKNATTFDWSRVDTVVAAASARHIKVLAILDYTPAWARASGCYSPKCAPASAGDFGDFATAAVTRYAPQGVHTWEIWNEENLATFWQPRPDASVYAGLLGTAYDAIHTADSSATVLMGGLGPTQGGGGSISPTDFLSGVYDAGGQGAFDALADHPYTYPQYPSHEGRGNAWSQMESTTPNLRDIMIANKDGDKKIWVTEYGVPTGGPEGVSEATQAKMMNDALSLWRGYSWAGPFFWYSYADVGRSQGTSENFFGLRRFDGSQKSAYGFFENAILGAWTPKK